LATPAPKLRPSISDATRGSAIALIEIDGGVPADVLAADVLAADVLAADVLAKVRGLPQVQQARLLRS
jgi:hypothetical protein